MRRKIRWAAHTELTQMMDHFVTGDDCSHGKPSPEVFLKALDKWNSENFHIKKEEALVFEDSPLGIKAANNAGIPAILIPDGIVDVEKVLKEYDAHPLMIIKSLDDFDFSKFKFGVCDNQ